VPRALIVANPFNSGAACRATYALIAALGKEKIRAAAASPKRDDTKLSLMATYPVLAFV
jgi:hypothetical protein